MRPEASSGGASASSKGAGKPVVWVTSGCVLEVFCSRGGICGCSNHQVQSPWIRRAHCSPPTVENLDGILTWVSLSVSSQCVCFSCVLFLAIKGGKKYWKEYS